MADLEFGNITSRISLVGTEALVSGPAFERLIQLVLQRLAQEQRRNRHLEGERTLFEGVVAPPDGSEG